MIAPAQGGCCALGRTLPGLVPAGAALRRLAPRTRGRAAAASSSGRFLVDNVLRRFLSGGPGRRRRAQARGLVLLDARPRLCSCPGSSRWPALYRSLLAPARPRTPRRRGSRSWRSCCRSGSCCCRSRAPSAACTSCRCWRPMAVAQRGSGSRGWTPGACAPLGRARRGASSPASRSSCLGLEIRGGCHRPAAAGARRASSARGCSSTPAAPWLGALLLGSSAARGGRARRAPAPRAARRRAASPRGLLRGVADRQRARPPTGRSGQGPAPLRRGARSGGRVRGPAPRLSVRRDHAGDPALLRRPCRSRATRTAACSQPPARGAPSEAVDARAQRGSPAPRARRSA